MHGCSCLMPGVLHPELSCSKFPPEIGSESKQAKFTLTLEGLVQRL